MELLILTMYKKDRRQRRMTEIKKNGRNKNGEASRPNGWRAAWIMHYGDGTQCDYATHGKRRINSMKIPSNKRWRYVLAPHIKNMISYPKCWSQMKSFSFTFQINMLGIVVAVWTWIILNPSVDLTVFFTVIELVWRAGFRRDCVYILCMFAYLNGD